MPNFISNPISDSSRLHSIDALRDLMMLFVLLDHVRKTSFLHRQIDDPMDVASTEPALFLSCTLARLCAPVFVFLTGLSALLYGEKYQRRRAVPAFLFEHGLLLVTLELTLVNFAWTFQLPPVVIYPQVIWAINLSMLALATLLWLPRPLPAALGVLLMVGHNLFDSLHFAPGSAWHLPWAVPHNRDWIRAGDVLRLRTSYPLLPWVGVIALSYAVDSWFSGITPATTRRRYLLAGGGGLLLGFILLRLLNGYGEKPWAFDKAPMTILMDFFNITKYPPSLLLLTFTLGIDLLLLAWLERPDWNGRSKALVTFGGAPMFFCPLYLYLLKLLYLLVLAIWGVNRDDYFGFSSVLTLWLCNILLVVALYPAVYRFVNFKTWRRDIVWLKYF